MSKPGYWVVDFQALAFETEDEAEEYVDALMSAFETMPESEEVGAIFSVKFEPDE